MIEKVFEISLVDIPKIKCALACIYRSSQSNAYEFIDKLETLIVKIQQKDNNVILCGDWNINFLQNSEQLETLQNVLVFYNLINTVTTATRVTKKSASLLDVMMLNHNPGQYSIYINLGYSDHLSQQ